MGTNCAPLVADLFLFCYERDLMMSVSDDKQADVIDAFNTTSRYLDDILNINNVYFDNIVSQIYPSELQLNKANTSDTKATFLDLHLYIYKCANLYSFKMNQIRGPKILSNLPRPQISWSNNILDGHP